MSDHQFSVEVPPEIRGKGPAIPRDGKPKVPDRWAGIPTVSDMLREEVEKAVTENLPTAEKIWSYPLNTEIQMGCANPSCLNRRHMIMFKQEYELDGSFPDTRERVINVRCMSCTTLSVITGRYRPLRQIHPHFNDRPILLGDQIKVMEGFPRQEVWVTVRDIRTVPVHGGEVWMHADETHTRIFRIHEVLDHRSQEF